jgi:Zn-dependent membrane protease YugP
MIFDPSYLLFMVPPLLLSLYASWRTKRAFKKYSQVRTLNGMTGAQAGATCRTTTTR